MSIFRLVVLTNLWVLAQANGDTLAARQSDDLHHSSRQQESVSDALTASTAEKKATGGAGRTRHQHKEPRELRKARPTKKKKKKKKKKKSGLTRAPVAAPVAPTPSPVATVAPVTPAPVSVTTGALECPQPDEEPIVLDLMNVTLRPSPIGSLCTIVEMSPENDIRPVARSYNGNDWERYAGDFSDLDLTCESGQCDVTLPALPDAGYSYVMTGFEHTLTTENEAARFLEKGTFGPTRTEIESFSTPASWVQGQFAEPITSHRQYYRERVGSWHQVPSMTTPLFTGPCDVGARYRTYAFTLDDKYRYMKIENSDTPGLLLLSMGETFDGQYAPRTMVQNVTSGSSREPGDIVSPGTYEVCWWETRDNGEIGSRILLEINGRCNDRTWFDGVQGNPPVYFDTLPFNAVDLANDWTPVMSEFFEDPNQVVQLTGPASTCEPRSYAAPGAPPSTVIGYAQVDGVQKQWIHTTTFDLQTNDLSSPLVDGGKTAVEENAEALRYYEGTTADEDEVENYFGLLCSNTPRTFLNEESCVISDDACLPGVDENDVELPLNIDTLQRIHNATGGKDGDMTRYVYVVKGLEQTGESLSVPPCTSGQRSRWEKVNGSCSDSIVTSATRAIFEGLLAASPDVNGYIRDIYFPVTSAECDAVDEDAFDFKVNVGGTCWQNTHVDNWNVYDFTQWTLSSTEGGHPGNFVSGGLRNPIKEFAEDSETFELQFPGTTGFHSMNRWVNNKDAFPLLGRFNDTTSLSDLPAELVRDDVFQQFIGDDDDIKDPRGPFVVCGSPFEVSNSHALETGDQHRGGFEFSTRYYRTTSDSVLIGNRQTAWTEIALKANDQLRQRVAWALSQLLVVSPDAIGDDSLVEAFFVYYDIFVRHAFGNYFDILKEVVYSPMMAEMLTYMDGQSTGYAWSKDGVLQSADENFAREIMQLFTIGLYQLNPDGTEKRDADGDTILSYSNTDISEYAKVYTGFERQRDRANIEITWGNRIDVMAVEIRERDFFPKRGLNNQYVGDGYPLCSDLPARHFLRGGATYRFLGGEPDPSLLTERYDVSETNAPAKRVLLSENSELRQLLCNPNGNGQCQFPVKVVLPSTLECEAGTLECEIDDPRVIEVDGVFFEYVRPACVNRAFFQNPQKIRARYSTESWWGGFGGTMCGDPTASDAGTYCCNNERTWQNNRVENFAGERITLAEAETRCSSTPYPLCNNPIPWQDCKNETLGGCETYYYPYWSGEACNRLAVKINLDGGIAIVHDIQGLTGVEDKNIKKMISNTTRMFFQVDWESSETDVSDFLSDYTGNCVSMGCELLPDGFCLCGVEVDDTQAYEDNAALATASVEDILSRATVGAFPPEDNIFNSPGVAGDAEYYPSGPLTLDTIFKVTDANGRVQFRKNVCSHVSFGDAGNPLVFRNPVHFINIATPNLRDAQYENDATLEHYFYHPNTAPFLATRFAQRFGISNPSPRYVDAIATAFRTGVYASEGEQFGSGEYGDMGAMIAAVLLDRESTTSLVDADPVHGSLWEPFLKIVRLMRSLDYQASPAASPLIEFQEDLQDSIGQRPHDLPSVFSFFKPEFQPVGAVGSAGLVSPEAQVLNGPTSISYMNSVLSFIKYGMNECYDGFGFGADDTCVIGDNSNSDGSVTWTPELPGALVDPTAVATEVVEQLSTVLTAGRLSQMNKDTVVDAYLDTLNNGKSDYEAFVNAQQLIVMSPEFNSNCLVRQTGTARPTPEDLPPTGKPYKAVVFVMLSGGYDSFNMIVPKSGCSATNELGENAREQYDLYRASLAMDFAAGEGDIEIDVSSSNQPCNTFALHEELPLLKELYDDGDLSFMANTGVINKNGMDPDNYNKLTRTQLFAHNAMQEETQKVDPYDDKAGTGVLGRMKDILEAKGHNVNSVSVDTGSISLDGVPGAGSPTTVVSRFGVKTFASRDPAEEYFDIEQHAAMMNSETEDQSCIFGEHWSQQLTAGVYQGDTLTSFLDDVVLPSYWYDGNRIAADDFGRREWAEQWAMIAQLIETRDNRNADRDLFYADLGGWDHHDLLKDSLVPMFNRLNHGLDLFVTQLKDAGLWDDVTIVVTSDFARTFTPNSNAGSDHAWGGNYFMMGGDVKGGQVLGKYPDDLRPADSPLVTRDGGGRGRFIPTTSWDAVWTGVLEWMGVDPGAEMDYCLPNAADTVDTDKGFQLFTQADLYE